MCGFWYRPERKCLTSFPDIDRYIYTYIFNFGIGCLFSATHKSNTHCAWRRHTFPTGMGGWRRRRTTALRRPQFNITMYSDAASDKLMLIDGTAHTYLHKCCQAFRLREMSDNWIKQKKKTNKFRSEKAYVLWEMGGLKWMTRRQFSTFFFPHFSFFIIWPASNHFQLSTEHSDLRQWEKKKNEMWKSWFLFCRTTVADVMKFWFSNRHRWQPKCGTDVDRGAKKGRRSPLCGPEKW